MEIKTVAKISSELAEEIRGNNVSYTQFNPIQDAENNWIISLLEAQYLEPNQFEIIIFNPLIIEHE